MTSIADSPLHLTHCGMMIFSVAKTPDCILTVDSISLTLQVRMHDFCCRPFHISGLSNFYLSRIISSHVTPAHFSNYSSSLFI